MMILTLADTCKDAGLATLISIVKKALDLIQLVGPILALVMLTVIFIRLMSNPEEKKLKNAIRNWAIALLMLFFIPVIVDATMNLLDDSFTVSKCWNSVDGKQSSKKPSYINPNSNRKPTTDHIIDPDQYESGS